MPVRNWSAPPSAVSAAEILPENLPEAWKGNVCSGLSISNGFIDESGKEFAMEGYKGCNKRCLTCAIFGNCGRAQPLPCDFSSAQLAKFKVTVGVPAGSGDPAKKRGPTTKMLTADTELGPSEVQDLSDVIPDLLKIRAKNKYALRFYVRIEMGDGKDCTFRRSGKRIERILKKVKEDFHFR